MMRKRVEFYYDYASPAAYLAWTQIPGICARHGAELDYRPVLLGGIFKATGNVTPVQVKPKGEWMFDDLARFAKRYDVPFAKNPYFIINSLPLMRGAMWAKTAGCLETYNSAIYEAMWVKQRNLGELDEIVAVVEEAGLDLAAMGDAIQLPEVKQQLIDVTASAVERGMFGVPTTFVDGVMHFGQDRLDWVEEALA